MIYDPSIHGDPSDHGSELPGTSWSLQCTFRAHVLVALSSMPRRCDCCLGEILNPPRCCVTWFIDLVRQQKVYMVWDLEAMRAHNSATDDFVPLLTGRLRRHRWRFLLGGTQDWLYPSIGEWWCSAHLISTGSEGEPTLDMATWHRQEIRGWTSHQKVLALGWRIRLQARDGLGRKQRCHQSKYVYKNHETISKAKGKLTTSETGKDLLWFTLSGKKWQLNFQTKLFTLRLFPTCQVRVVRFYVSCLLLLLSSSPLLLSSSSCSTATLDAQWSLSDLNHDHPRPVFPAGPQPRPSPPVFPAGPQPRVSPPSVPCRTSTTTIHAQCSLPDLM